MKPTATLHIVVIHQLCVLLLLSVASLVPAKRSPFYRLHDNALIKGYRQSYEDPRWQIRFTDSLCYWYYPDSPTDTIRYKLLADCQTNVPASVRNANFLAFWFKDGTHQCNDFLGASANSLSWMYETGRIHTFKRIKKVTRTAGPR